MRRACRTQSYVLERSEGISESRGNWLRIAWCPCVLTDINLYSSVPLVQTSRRFAAKQRNPQALGLETSCGLRRWHCTRFPLADEVLDTIVAVRQEFALPQTHRCVLTSRTSHRAETVLLQGPSLQAKPLKFGQLW